MKIPTAFPSGPDTETDGSGKRPLIFDVLGPNRRSILPPQYRLVLHVNPASLGIQQTATLARQQTMGGWVEADWGMAPTAISANGVTGGFVHLYNGLVSITGPTPASSVSPYSEGSLDIGGSRRETLAYDRFLDLLALFYHNAAVYDSYGRASYQGRIKLSYNGMDFIGLFENFSVAEDPNRPFLLSYTFSFKVQEELVRGRSIERGTGGL